MADQDIAALVARADLPAIVASFTQLKKRGSEYQFRCPFHSPDEHPSGTLYHKNGKWNFKCFVCGQAGDALDWIEQLEGLPKPDALKRLNGGSTWQPIAPAEVPKKLADRTTSKPPAGNDRPASFKLREIGEPARIWTYRDADGAVLMYVCRYEVDGRKEIRPWTWGTRGDEPARWGVGHWSGPRPLYGLDRLSALGGWVSVTEGEKAADAAADLLPDYAAVTWAGGAKAWHKADLQPLAGRKVLLIPDNDEAGKEAMQKIAAILHDQRGLACPAVRIVDPEGQADGWDVADALAEGWDTAKLVAWAKPRAKDYAPPAAPEPPPEPPIPLEVYRNDPPPKDAPEAAVEKPKRKRRPELSVVEGNAARAPETDEEMLPAPMSEDALAEDFATHHAKCWRYVKVWGSWFEWQGDGWHKDDTAKIDRLAVEATRRAIYWREALALTPDQKRRVNSKRTAGNVRDLAMSDRRIAATVDQWDRDPWLLGVPGGVVDLKTGKLMDAEPEQYITKRTGVAPADGDCPHWMQLLGRVTQGDSSLLGYLQRLCGYVLTGETREECFAFLYGPAQTGKSTFIRAISEILGEYHCKASMETFTESRHERHSEELAVLVGARLVTAVETEEGKRWNESRIKALTGRDRIRARFMRENSFEFEPQFKLLIAGNHAPHLRNVDEAMRRRLHIIPFTNPVPMEERDDGLAEKLRSEYPQILAWMIRGAIEWQDCKLGRPEQVSDAVDQYLEAEDTLGAWLEEAAERDARGKCLSGGAYRNFKNWADQNGEHSMSQKRFVQALKERGFDTTRSNGQRYIAGLSLKVADAPTGYYQDQ